MRLGQGDALTPSINLVIDFVDAQEAVQQLDEIVDLVEPLEGVMANCRGGSRVQGCQRIGERVDRRDEVRDRGGRGAHTEKPDSPTVLGKRVQKGR